MRKRLLSMVIALGLVLSALIGTLGPASADHPQNPGFLNPEMESAAHVYFPWVPSGSEIDGTGPWYGTVTLQNLEPVPAELDVYVGNNGFQQATTVWLEGNGSTTLSASQLGVQSPGGSVKVLGWLNRGQQAHKKACGDFDTVAEAATYGCPVENGVLTDPSQEVDIEAEAAVYARIAGVAKQVANVPSSDGKTSALHTIVDGYTGLNMDQVHGTEDSIKGYHILPIAQTNNGWNTHLRIANMAQSGHTTPFTVTLYPTGGQGQDGESIGEFTGSLGPGQVASFNISDSPAIDEGWIGTAFITSSSPIAAVAERVKPETDMLIMNVSRPEFLDPAYQVAPLIFKNYHYWNTGISVANTDELQTNTVSVNYYSNGGSWTPNQMNIPPRVMEFIYMPTQLPEDSEIISQESFLGAAILAGSTTHHSVIDQVKYFGIGNDVGHAMSYPTEHELATGAGMHAGSGDVLALPLFQKGNPNTGLGDTSGIQLFNASGEHEAKLEITIFDTVGKPVSPTHNMPIPVTLSPHAGHTLYAHDLTELPVGFQGSVQIRVSGEGKVAAVSNNVNYDVNGDGSAAYNLVKVPGVPIEPEATHFRAWPVSDTNELGDDHNIYVEVLDQWGNPINGVNVWMEVTETTGATLAHWGIEDSSTTAIYEGMPGVAVLSYAGEEPAHDTITIQVAGIEQAQAVTKSWIYGDPEELIVMVEAPEDNNVNGLAAPMTVLDPGDDAPLGEGTTAIIDGRFALLHATVKNQHGFNIPNVQVQFEDLGQPNEYGGFSDEQVYWHGATDGGDVTRSTDQNGNITLWYRQRGSEWDGLTESIIRVSVVNTTLEVEGGILFQDSSFVRGLEE